jgi:hypothetical protein
MHEAAIRFIRRGKQRTVILHLGDHDPSGIDMTRDIRDRMNVFLHHHGRESIELRRIALNMDQVDKYGPPPNPAKLSDSRSGGYIDRYGPESWELDSLPPDVLEEVILENIRNYVDMDRLRSNEKADETSKHHLSEVARRWPDVVGLIDEE